MALELISVNEVQVPAKVVKVTAAQKETRKMIEDLIAAGTDVVGKLPIKVDAEGKSDARSTKMSFIHGFKAATGGELAPKMWESADGSVLFIQVVKGKGPKAEAKAEANGSEPATTEATAKGK